MKPKFRAWNKADSIMIYFDLNQMQYYCREPFELMQFTGLFDKSGKEIWEGDCFKSHWRNEPFVIIFEDGAFRGKYNHNKYGFIFDMREAIDGEVIGDIYSNPELLANTQASL